MPENVAASMSSAHGVAPRSIPRTLVLVLIGALALAALVVSLPATVEPGGVFGWNVAPDGVTVISVLPGDPAQRAGIVPGDRIVYQTMPLLGRLNTIFVTPVQPGARIAFSIVHEGNARTVDLRAVPWPSNLLTTSVVAGLIANIVGIAVGIMLVALRPTPMTWAFLIYGIGALIPFNGASYALRSDAAMAAVLTANGLLGGVATAAAFVFIGRFPRGEPRRWTAWLDRAAIPWAIVVAAGWIYVLWAVTSSSQPPDRIVLTAIQYALPALGAAVTLAALVANYAAARGSMRHRILPVLGTFALATFFGFVWTVANDLSPDPLIAVGSGIVAQAFDAAFPLSVAYAVVRHRVMDVTFVISRTVVYTILTATIVCSFALIHFLVGKWLEHTQIAFVLELVVAVAYGVSLNALHGRLERYVDRVLFRRRHLAESRLTRVANALPHAESADFVDDMLAIEVAAAFALASCAGFRTTAGGTLVRTRAVGWLDGHLATLERDDRLVVELTAALEPLALSDVAWPHADVPDQLGAPLYAVPICVRHRVVAIALYGGHRTGEALDPDETRVLRRLANGAGAAYDHIATAALRERLEEVERENAGLRAAQGAIADATLALREEIATLDRALATVRQRP